MTNQALSQRVALSPSACLTRVRRLEETGVIAGYQARLYPWALGPSLILFAEVTLKSHHPADLARFEAVLRDIPEVVEASKVSGPFDYLLQVVVSDMPAWTRLGEGLIERDLGIDKVTTHVLMKKPKVFQGYPTDAPGARLDPHRKR